MKKENIIKIIVISVLVLIIAGIFIYKNSTKVKSENIGNKTDKSENMVNIYSNEKNLPVFLEFGSTTCEPCKTMVPITASIEKKYEGKLVFKFINIYEDIKTSEQYKIRVVPTQIFLNSDGKLMYRHEGVMYEDEIINKLKEMGVN